MLRSVQDLRGATIRATDDEIGSVDQFLFDDEFWTIRYMVVNTGNWLTGRLVLLSPRAIIAVDWDDKALAVNLTRQKVQDAPDIATDRPVSRQMEAQYGAYYGYPPYWGGVGLWGAGIYPYTYAGYGAAPMYPTPGALEREFRHVEAEPQPNDTQATSGDTHLRSTQEVQGYHIRARDGEIGHVEDFLLDDETWAIRYLVVDTSNWWFGNQVLISPGWVTAVSWRDSLVDVDVTREAIKNGPPFDRSQLSRDYEAQLHRHYGQRGYWEEVS